jgi:UDP-glucose 4-epimerase
MEILVNALILILGGSGYLGQRLVSYLQKNSLPCSVATSKPNKVSPDHTVYLDYYDEFQMTQIFSKYDLIINAAGPSSTYCTKEPLLSKRFYEESTLAICKALHGSRVKNFINLSTIHVYGELQGRTLDELTLPDPQSSYGKMHLERERLFFQGIDSTEINFLNLRLSNAVGAPINSRGESWNLLFNDLAKTAVMNHRIKILSNPAIQRDFFAIKDLCRFIATNSNFSQQGTYNFCSSDSIDLNTAALTLRDSMQRNFSIELKLIFEVSAETSQPLLILNNKIKKDFKFYFTDLTAEIDNLMLRSAEWFGVHDG